MRALLAASKAEHRNVLNWVLRKKPLGPGQYDFMFHRDDFVLLSGKKRTGVFDRFIVNTCLTRWPKFLQVSSLSSQGRSHFKDFFLYHRD